MLLPGPEAMQIATFAGWRLHGVRGGLAAGLMFVLPGTVDPALPSLQTHVQASPGQTLRTVFVWLVVWIVPLGALAVMLGRDSLYSELGVFSPNVRL